MPDRKPPAQPVPKITPGLISWLAIHPAANIFRVSPLVFARIMDTPLGPLTAMKVTPTSFRIMIAEGTDYVTFESDPTVPDREIEVCYNDELLGLLQIWEP